MASSMHSLVGSICALLVVASQVGATILDKTGNEPVDTGIARHLCHGSSWHSKRISRISTIEKLHDFLGTIAAPEYELCRNQYLAPLKELLEVVRSDRANVCSSNKVQLIDNFHWKYIVSGLSKKWRAASDATLPEPLRIFFLHYANEIAQECKRTAAERLEGAVGERGAEVESLFSSNFGSVVDSLNKALVPKDSIKNYGDFMLLWNQILDKEHRKGRVLVKVVDDFSGEQMITLMKAKNPAHIWAVQQKCRLELRPYYKDTILPVMRLLELGYGQVDAKTRPEREQLALMKNWYAVTQLCELLIPVNFFKDDTLKENEVVVLPGYREAQGLGRPEGVVHVNDIKPRVDTQAVRLNYDELPAAGDSRIVKQVRSSIKARAKFFRTIFKNLLLNVKQQVTSTLRNFFVSKRSNRSNKYEKESGEKLIENSGAEIDEILSKDESERPHNKRFLSRKKRYITQAEAESQVKTTVNCIVTFVALAVVAGIITLAIFHG